MVNLQRMIIHGQIMDNTGPWWLMVINDSWWWVTIANGAVNSQPEQEDHKTNDEKVQKHHSWYGFQAATN